MTRILAIDPGTTTGLAVYLPERKVIETRQIGPEDHHEVLYKLCYQSDEIVCEDFNFRPNPGRRKIVLDSKEYIGVVKLVNQQYGIPYRLQQPSQAKNLWDDKKLKALRLNGSPLWSPGNPHAMDALRHLLYYLTVWKKDHSWVNQLKGKL